MFNSYQLSKRVGNINGRTQFANIGRDKNKTIKTDKMLQAIQNLSQEFLKLSENKPVRIISHHDTDGIASATIIAKVLKRLNKKFSIKITKGLEETILKKELAKQPNHLLFFTDLASGNLEHFQNLQEPIFILDHHEINIKKLKQINQNNKIKIINPHLFNEEEICGAGLSYLFANALSKENSDLSKLAILGMIGDRHESNISKIYQQIIKDTKELTIKKGLLLYPATRPLCRALEWSTNPYLPGITGSQSGVTQLLRETNIDPRKSLYELNQDEMSRLITSIMVKLTNHNKQQDIIGNLYLLKFLNTKEDVRELSVLINACSRLGHSDIALALCMENKQAKLQAKDIYTKYKQQLISGLHTIEKTEKIRGSGFVIVNAKNQIKDTIIGTLLSMLSSSIDYEEGTILVGMAYNQDKIKVSARIAGRNGRNLKEVLEKTIISFKQKHTDTKVEIGGHHYAAGCLIEKDKEQDFITELRKQLEIEVVKI